ncbi:L-2-amino-thiazoline-4-carboxylic acid hydrolase [Laedolimicola intestinihominis]|uniref:L-2-amino-thiazoline-4-carboxylic acid hydrolase n=1 Tax=Laedolimicola intestinihominis TaxID=3133166 RepID=A0ABV1FD40_9FIRM
MMKRRFARFWKLLGLLLLCATPKKKSTGFVFWRRNNYGVFDTNTMSKQRRDRRANRLCCDRKRCHQKYVGCPELTKIFCANDDRFYGNLPGLEFRRTGTLGTGASRCDFNMKKR